MTLREAYTSAGAEVSCPPDQLRNFRRARLVLQSRQLAASAAARLCDHPDGPTAIGYGGARGGGKSHWLMAQMGADDCQRVPGLKCLLLRKVGKANLEQLEDLRRKCFARVPHEFTPSRGILTFANGSRIVAGHFQNERDIDAYLGLEYDVIGVEEATTLTARKYSDISTCCRTSRPNWRPRIYSTTNPGGVGHAWYRKKFIIPFQNHQRHLNKNVGDEVTRLTNPGSALINTSLQRGAQQSKILSPSPGGEGRGEGEPFSPTNPLIHQSINPLHEYWDGRSATTFIPARVTDNQFTNVEYQGMLEGLTGWQKRAWLHGDWDIAAGQFFTTFRRDIHVVANFDEGRAMEWFAALDYGYNHYTVVLLGCEDGDGNLFVVDEHAERQWLPQRNAAAIHAMLARHNVSISGKDAVLSVPNSLSGHHPSTPNHQRPFLPPPGTHMPCVYPPGYVPKRWRPLARFVAGQDVFSTQSDGRTIDQQYRQERISLRRANMDRINGWAEILHRLGNPEAGIAPRLFIHERCARLIECLPSLQHDPNRPEDVLKVGPDEDGAGGDDTADALRYLVATKPRLIHQVKLRGF